MNRRWQPILIIFGIFMVVAAVILYLILRPSGVLAPPSTSVPTFPPASGLEITPPPSLADLADEYPDLADVLTDPELDSVYKEFLIAYQEGGEDAARELAHARGLLTPDERSIRVTLVLDTQEHEPLIAQLESAGVTVVSAFEDRINVAVPVELIEIQLDTEEPGAIFDHMSELEHVIAVRLPEQRLPESRNVPGEGVALTSADDWHAAGFRGAGVRIGVLDLGFAGHESLLGTELPDSITMERFGWIDEHEVHGTACAEIVHEMAPDAELVFAWYDGTDAAMGQAVEWLMDQGVHIISNSTGGIAGPRDGSGWDSRLVDRVAGQGILWVNSSGNEALSHYRGTFTDSDGNGLHEFGSNDEMLGLYLGRSGRFRLILQWEDSWENAQLDYDLYLYDVDGNLVGASDDYQTGQSGQEPLEGIGGQVDDAVLYATVVSAGAERAVPFDIFVVGADIAYSTPEYSVNTPGDAIGSLTVGAVNFWDDSLADYSSRGPTADNRLKPEISAPTGVSGATYGQRAFDGTSSSCPHVSGASALVWQAYPSYGRDQLVDYLLNNALDLGPVGPDTGYGYGRLQLPAPPNVVSAPMPTSTPVQELADVPPVPLPTPTPVVYAVPQPEEVYEESASFLAVSLSLLCMGGMGCLGSILLVVGIAGLLIRGWRSRRRPPRRPPARSGPQRASSGPRQPAWPPPSSPSPPPSRAQGRPQPQAPPSSKVASQRKAGAPCSHCGAPTLARARFCSRCGRPLGRA